MSRFIIEGGHPLNGEIEVAANKNAVLPMMAAALLTDEDCFLDNVPAIADVGAMAYLPFIRRRISSNDFELPLS